jgi:hypothetical protein
MWGVLIAIAGAALALVLCAAVGLPQVVAIAAAFLVLVSGIGSDGYGLRIGGRGRT